MTDSQKFTSREAQAMAEVGRTTVRPVIAWLLTFVFLAGIAVVPVTQQVADIRAFLAGTRASALPQCYNIFRKPPGVGAALGRHDLSLYQRIVEANRNLMRVMHAYEDRLENDSIVGGWVRAPTQLLMARWLGAGNDKVYCGRRTWLFYRPEIEYLTGPGFLEPRQLARRIAGASEWRSPPQPDPIKAILDFRDQLAQRGIVLIVMPAPIKPMIHPEQFVRAYEDWPVPLANPSYARFVSDLRQAGVPLFDIAQELVDLKRHTGYPQYLATDTHWRPEALEHAARRLALFIEKQTPLPPVTDPGFKSRPATVSHHGDIAIMLKLPAGQAAYPPETVSLRQVLAPNGNPWRPDETSDVLVLGDSFCNIYSLDAMGWGEGAGLIEQLSFELQRPLDRLVINDNGAYATRALLARELARGRDRLAGKRLVIWQFAMRELAAGDWKSVSLVLGKPAPDLFVVPAPGKDLIVRGVVRAIAPVPRPGSVPYKDHVVAAHIVDLECSEQAIHGNQALVYLSSMRDNAWTPAASLQPGDAVSMRLRPWSDAAPRYERINRTELPDDALQLAEPCWGELIAAGQ